MNAASVYRVLSLIPSRMTWVLSGTVASPAHTVCGHPERLACLERHANWLGALSALEKDEQQLLGLIGANGRALHAGDVEDEALADTESDPIEIES